MPGRTFGDALNATAGMRHRGALFVRYMGSTIATTDARRRSLTVPRLDDGQVSQYFGVANGHSIVDANLDDYVKEHAKRHPGILREKGHIGFQSYNKRVEFKNIVLKAL